MRIKQTPVVALTVLFVASCSTAPMSFVAMTSSPAEASFECAVLAVKNMRYTITNETPRSITAEKKTSGAGRVVLDAVVGLLSLGTNTQPSDPTWSALTVSTFDTPAGETNLRVTVWHATGDRAATHGSRSSKPSAHGISDARGILNACGKGEIAEHACASRKNWKPMSSCT